MKNLIKNKLIGLQKYTKTDMLYLVKSNYWLNLNFLFSSIMSFVFSVFLANQLSKDTFGLYQFIISSFSIITTFTLTGMNTIIVKNTAMGLEGTMKKSIGYQLINSLPASIISIAISFWYLVNENYELSLGFFIIALLSPIITTFNSYNSFLIGKKMFQKHFTYNLFFNFIYYGGMIFIICKNPKLIWLVFFNYFITSVLHFWLYKKSLQYQENKNYEKDFKEKAKHQSISNILPSILLAVDSIVIYKLIGPSALAIYTIVSNIPIKMFGILRNIITSATPKIPNQSLENIKNNIIQKTFKFIILGIGLGILYLIIAKPIFNIFFSQYREYMYLTYLFIIPAILSVASSFSTTSFILSQEKRNIYVFNTVYPIVNIIIIILGGFYAGIIGIIAGRSLGYLFTIILSVTMIKQARNQ